LISKSNRKSSACVLPANLAEVALIDAKTCAAAGDMSLSWWHEEVRAGRAPAAVIRKPRCTRWRLADVRAFWIEYAAKAAADTEAAALMRDKAMRASAKAKVSRASRTRTTSHGVRS
jgi:hypothetical protein